MGLLITIFFLIIIFYVFTRFVRPRSTNANDKKYSNTNNKDMIPLNHQKQFPVSKSPVSFNVSHESSRVEIEYPLFDATKLPIAKYCIYKVKGKNPATNYMKTNKVFAKQGTPEHIITQRSGLLEPYTITPFLDEPSQAQIDLAKDINIIFPSDCSMEDLSVLISRQFDGDQYINYINADLLEYAATYNIAITPYASNQFGVYKIIHSLPPKECVVFFAYLVYCGSLKIEVGNLYNLPNYHVFYDFVDTIPDVDETGKYIIKHYNDKFIVGNIDRRNPRLAQLHDSIQQYLIDKSLLKL